MGTFGAILPASPTPPNDNNPVFQYTGLKNALSNFSSSINNAINNTGSNINDFINNTFISPFITPTQPAPFMTQSMLPPQPMTQAQILQATNGGTRPFTTQTGAMALGNNTYIPPVNYTPYANSQSNMTQPNAPANAPVVMTFEQIWNMKANQRRQQMTEVTKPVFVRGQTFGVSKQQVTGRFSAG